MSIQKLGVIGVGQMGSGIVQVAAQAGLTVLASDKDGSRNEKAKAKIEKGLSRLVEKGKLSDEDLKATLGRITWTTSLQDFADQDLVIEAITENPQAKEELFKQLDEICSEKTVLATNTSSISVTRLAAVTRRPNKFIGLHFFNPVPVMKLLEVIKALSTDEATYAVAKEIGEKLNKQIVTAQDSAAFIVNRTLIPFLNEAAFVLYEGVGTAEDIDQAIKLGLNHPMGPLELSDFVGLDVVLAVLDVLYREFGDVKYRACPLLRKYVEAGWLGRKTGRGFYNYA
ncbi:MAG: 3-hydroxybutyryl-CoA dehydrogenase [Deltaproteobacteria bacterium]|nr:3-hydroxybutyryl-CoA dehydrogenase [Deltaproteobacteria bacterium]